MKYLILMRLLVRQIFPKTCQQNTHIFFAVGSGQKFLLFMLYLSNIKQIKSFPNYFLIESSFIAMFLVLRKGRKETYWFVDV